MSDLDCAVTQLDSGLRVASARLPHVETVAVGLWIGAGTRDETPAECGVAHLLEHMAFKGTSRRDARRIAEAIESVGGSLDAHTSRDHTAYYARLLAADLPLALDIIADIVQHSTLDETELERERQVVLQEIAEVADTPDDLVFDLFQETAFPDQALGWPILGRRDSIARMSRERLCHFMGQCYAAERAVVAAAGKVDHAQLTRLAAELFAELPSRGRGPAAEAHYRGGEGHIARDLDQVHIVLGGRAVGREHPDYYACHLLSNILGGGMASRLFQEIREQRGLAYSVFSFYNAWQEIGLFGVYSSTEPAHVRELLEVTCNELHRMAVEGPRPDELQRAKRQLEASLLMSLESCAAVSEDMARQLLFFGRRLELAELLERIQAVEPADVERVAREILAGAPPTLAAVGPLANLPDYGTVQRWLA